MNSKQVKTLKRGDTVYVVSSWETGDIDECTVLQVTSVDDNWPVVWLEVPSPVTKGSQYHFRSVPPRLVHRTHTAALKSIAVELEKEYKDQSKVVAHCKKLLIAARDKLLKEQSKKTK